MCFHIYTPASLTERLNAVMHKMTRVAIQTISPTKCNLIGYRAHEPPKREYASAYLDEYNDLINHILEIVIVTSSCEGYATLKTTLMSFQLEKQSFYLLSKVKTVFFFF